MGIAVSQEQLKDWQRRGLIESEKPAEIAKPITSAVQPPLPVRFRLRVTVPIRVQSESNIGRSLREKLARKAAVKSAVWAALSRFQVPGTKHRVTLTRLGGKRLDQGNISVALKPVQDMVAKWLGIDDGDRSRVRWKYRQQPAWAAGVMIEIAW